VVFEAWSDAEPVRVVRRALLVPSRYRAGRFFERELPCLLAVLELAGQEWDTVLIDGYVHLREDLGPGLGQALHDALPKPVAVVGVAKNPLAVAGEFVEVYRGRSRKPLFVSAIGCLLELAADRIASMHGPHRIPRLLRMADQIARSR
jgi:deoxyribonuclease V